MKRKTCGIYKIINNVSGHFYIGLSRNIENRFREHRFYLKRNQHDNDRLQKSWNKYGEKAFAFEVIEECDEDKLNEREIYWIDYYGGYKSPNLYNLKEGGNSAKPSLETIEKLRKANLGKTCYWKGKKLPREMVEKARITRMANYEMPPELKIKCTDVLRNYWKDKQGYWTGKTMSEEHRKKLSESHKGHKSWNKGNRGMISEETREKLKKSHLGHTHSIESRIKISEGLKGRTISSETRKKLSESNKGQRRFWIHKENINTTVPLERMQEYLDNGWEKGYISNRIWITNGIVNKQTTLENLNDYIQKGWRRGRIRK